MAKRAGMLPGEYMKVGHVTVWPEGIDGEMTVHGLEVRPEIYLVTVRKLDGRFRTEVMRGVPIDDGVIPHDVLKRIMRYYDTINSEERSDRAKEAAADRKAASERRNGIHVLPDDEA